MRRVARTGEGRAAVVTIAAKPMWAHARVVAESFHRHHPDIEVFALLADQPGDEFDVTGEPFTVLTLDDLGGDVVADLPVRYGQQALSFALTPLVLRWLLDREYRRVVFIKQESMVVGSLDSVFDALDRHSLVVLPHLVGPLDGAMATDRELNVLQSGVFNGGLVGVSAGEEAGSALLWWADRVRRRCELDVELGLHFEQRWLDMVLSYFPGVHVLDDPSIGVGHWNLAERWPHPEECRLFRASGFDPLAPGTVTRYHSRIEMSDIGASAALFDTFGQMLLAAGHEQCRHWPYAFARFPDGTLVPELGRRLYDTWPARPASAAALLPDALQEFRDWLVCPSAHYPAGPLWDSVYRRRADLRAAFHESGGQSSPQFRAWTVEHGCAEFDIDSRLGLA
jgi:hypothetical protein